MRKLLLVILLFCANSGKSQTWIYHSMPDSNAVWNFEAINPCPQIVNLFQNFSITISGDTTINSITYHKLFTPFVFESYIGTNCGSTFPGYKGAIRQDTLLKSVYIVKPFNNTEQLLYDFTLQVGDTLKGVIASISVDADTVISIDSILVGGSYRKKWNITNGISIIEGLGSTYGLVQNSTAGLIGTFSNFSITCFSQNGASIYPNNTISCPLITSLNTLNEIVKEIKIYPNPSKGIFIVDFNGLEIKEIILNDLFGQLILKENTSNSINLSIDNLKTGLYILTIIDKNNKSTFYLKYKFFLRNLVVFQSRLRQYRVR